MTNLEHIRSLNERELFEFLYELNIVQCWCPAREICNKYSSCEEAFIAWLQLEYKD